MGKSKPNEPITQAQAGPAPAQSLHEQFLAVQSDFNDLSNRISREVAGIEAAVRDVARCREEERSHLAAYQRNLLAGEKAAADAALAEVHTCRERAARAIEAVKKHARAAAELRAHYDRVRTELDRLMPLTTEAVRTAQQDQRTIAVLGTVLPQLSGQIRDEIERVVAAFSAEEGQ